MQQVLQHYTPYGWRLKIGMIVPRTNSIAEAELWRMAPEGVTIHTGRMVLHVDSADPAGRQALLDDLAGATREIAQAGPDVIAYNCTAGSLVSPLELLTDHISEVGRVPGVATGPAIVAALRALGVRRIALATPYHEPVNRHEIAFFAEHGIETVADRGLGIGAGGPDEYRNLSRVPPEVAYRLARTVDRPEAEALVISCADFATLPILPRLEAELGKPVVSSNLALFWAALRAGGVHDRPAGHGRLLAER